MRTIDTYIEETSVEIEGKVYEVAAKTVDVAEKLMEAGRRMSGQPEYKLWLAEMEIILGKAAVKELFNGGKKENIDRMFMIYSGVLEAFEYNADKINDAKLEKQQDKIAGVTDMIKQIIAAANIGDDPGKVIRRR
jgi:hypothetical protein